MWNESHTARSSYPLRTPALLERWVFSKPYFDHDGLIVAVDEADNRKAVGYVLAGFAPNEELTALSLARGDLFASGPHPVARRNGVARDLVRKAEEYLTARGADDLRAGPRWPYCPYGFGLYGGTNCPGFLASDPGADPFFQSLGYAPAGTTFVFHKKLDSPLTVADARFALLRRRYETQVLRAAGVPSWWHDCVWGTLEPVEFRMRGQAGEQLPGRPGGRVGTRRLRLAVGIPLRGHHRHPGPAGPAQAGPREAPDLADAPFPPGPVLRHLRNSGSGRPPAWSPCVARSGSSRWTWGRHTSDAGRERRAGNVHVRRTSGRAALGTRSSNAVRGPAAIAQFRIDYDAERVPL